MNADTSRVVNSSRYIDRLHIVTIVPRSNTFYYFCSELPCNRPARFFNASFVIGRREAPMFQSEAAEILK